MDENMIRAPRKHYLDWLRVLGILVVFLYHSSRFFDANNSWHIKNGITFVRLRFFLAFTEQWMMPLMIIVSGASVYFSLTSRRAGSFLKERVLRLFVPLTIGIFTHSIWQIYLERLAHNQFVGSFWQFLPEYFQGLYGFGGNFAWMGVHLWYLLVLFMLSIIFLPLFLMLKSKRGARVLQKVGDFLALPGAVILVIMPTVVIMNTIGEDSPLGRQDFGGWGLAAYLWFFFAGFLLVSNDRLQERIRQIRWVSLLLALLFGTIGYTRLIIGFDVPEVLGPVGDFFFGDTHDDLGSWTWLLAIIGFAIQHLRNRSTFVDYCNEAVLPFYILHQPILLTIGYLIIPLAIAPALKWATIMPVSFAVILALYHFLVRRYNVLRFVFGMKTRPATRPSVAPPSRRSRPAARNA